MGKQKRADNSVRVEQNNKISRELTIRPFKWTEKQQRFIEAALDKNTRAIICRGKAGTGKTLLSLYCCLELMNRKVISDIIFYRNPIESAAKSLGYLSGNYDEKIAPYGEPLQDHLKELTDKATADSLFKEGRISIDSIGFAKGRTHNATGIILDEAEDLNIQELELIMGRMGRFSKVFIIGDDRQSNIKNSGFTRVLHAFNNEEATAKGIVTFEFGVEDIMRDPLLKYILGVFESLT
jgi:phosphate starvation-inducible PhoH-like protein